MASILLLGILLFNWFGYRVLSSYVEEHANRQLEARLDDNQYNESELISIKVPAEHLGYYINSKNFERISGQIEIGGIQYNYVKRRLYNDSLELLCIPNHEAMQCRTAKNEFFKLINDLQISGQGKKSDTHSGAYKILSPDYYTVNDLFQLGERYYTFSGKSFYYSCTIINRSPAVIGQPPESAA